MNKWKNIPGNTESITVTLQAMTGNPTSVLVFLQGGKNPTLLWSVRMSAILHHKAADGGTAWAPRTESSQVSKPAGSFSSASTACFQIPRAA